MAIELEFPYECSHNFLKMFDLINKDADLCIGVVGFQEGKESKVIKEFSDTLTAFHMSLFTLTFNDSELNKKMNHSFDPVEGGHWWFFNFASFLGLPGNNPLEEIKEFKSFLTSIKDVSMANITERITLQIYRVFDEAGVELLSDNKELQTKINQDMNQKIDDSPVLTAWKNNQISAIKNTEPHLSTLWSNALTTCLMEPDEIKLWINSRPKNTTISMNNKIRKNRKF